MTFYEWQFLGAVNGGKNKEKADGKENEMNLYSGCDIRFKKENAIKKGLFLFIVQPTVSLRPPVEHAASSRRRIFSLKN